MDAINDPTIETVVGKMSAQVGKTELILNVIGYFIHQDPSPILALQPTLGLAEAFSKDRLAPMLRDTPALRGSVSDARARDGANTLLHKSFPGGHITLAGANSPASLASRPIRIVLCDEVDRYPASAGTEGDPVKLAKKRTTTFFNRKEVLLSTPTVKGASRIDDAWELSDKRRYFVPCPHCGHSQTLRWENVKWKVDPTDPRKCLPDSVFIECEEGREPIIEGHKPGMLDAGKWIGEKPTRGTAGFHLNELYSPWKRWASVVDDFLEAKDDPEKLKVWVNTSMGEAFEIKGEDTPEWKKLYDRRETYPVGQLPERACLLTGGVDVQKDRIEVTVVGWNRRESWVIDHVVIPGDTSTPVPWRRLSELIDHEWPHEAGQSLRIRLTAIDSGYNTTHVYDYVRHQNQARVMAVKGSDKLDIPVGVPSRIDMTARGKRARRGVRLWPVGVSILKADLYAKLKIERPTDEAVVREGWPRSYVHFPALDEEYFKQLVAEQLILSKTKSGHTKPTWIKSYPANECLDTMIYNIAAYYAIGAHRWSNEQWAGVEAQLGVHSRPEQVEVAPGSAPLAESQPKKDEPQGAPQSAKRPNFLHERKGNTWPTAKQTSKRSKRQSRAG